MCAESLCQLLAPLDWPHAFAPVLPARCSDFLLSPMPYLFGTNIPQPKVPKDVVLVFIDKDTVELPADMQLPAEIPKFPLGTLIDKLQPVLTGLSISSAIEL